MMVTPIMLEIQLSLILDGEILGHLDDKEGVLTTHIDVDLVDQQREYIPVFRNLKPHLYK